MFSPLCHESQVAATAGTALETLELSRSFPRGGSHYSRQKWLGVVFISVWRYVQRPSACPGELLVQTAKEQDREQTCWKGTGLVPSHPTALLGQDWRSNVRSPGSQPRDLFMVNAAFALSHFVGCMAVDSC